MSEISDIATKIIRPHPRAQNQGTQILPLRLADLQAFDTIIDTRSEREFAEDHLPGAVNYPVLDNEQRIAVGTRYKQSSAFEAKKIGATMVARNIARHIDDAFHDKPKNWKPLIYCWRGGSRSGAMTHVFRSIGWGAVQLEGGYKAWRAQVRADLDTLPLQFSYQVICGRTGSGKSRLLEALDAAGAQVLDLEKLAAHKGSVLGNLPHEPQPSQKMFDTRIWSDLSRFSCDRPVFVEAESRKVGALRVPEALITRMRESACHEVMTPPALRVELLKEEYTHLIKNRDELFFKLDCLKGLHSAERIDNWKALAMTDQWNEFVASMLEHHYDPAYERSMFSNYTHAQTAAPISVDSITVDAFARIAATMNTR
jgi:tRNA 2-selenouridine synthase